MKVISSQRYLDTDIIEEKINKIGGSTEITLPVIYAGEWDDESLYVLVDGHHTLAAAIELGITVEYNIRSRSEAGYNTDWTMDEMLEACWLDSDWYDVEDGSLIF